MSTRCITLLKDSGITVATIYRHCDGYPEGMGEDLKNFFMRRKNSLMTLLAANFVAEINANNSDTLELYPEFKCEAPRDLVEYMKDTDWEYGYIINMNRDETVTMTVIHGGEIVFHDKVELFF